MARGVSESCDSVSLGWLCEIGSQLEARLGWRVLGNCRPGYPIGYISVSLFRLNGWAFWSGSDELFISTPDSSARATSQPFAGEDLDCVKRMHQMEWCLCESSVLVRDQGSG